MFGTFIWSDEIWPELQHCFNFEKYCFYSAGLSSWYRVVLVLDVETYVSLYHLHVSPCCTLNHDPITFNWINKIHVPCNGTCHTFYLFIYFFTSCAQKQTANYLLSLASGAAEQKWDQSPVGLECDETTFEISSAKDPLDTTDSFWKMFSVSSPPYRRERNKLNAFHVINCSASALTSVVNEGRV